jgi:anti-sigma B factor antagonist
VDVEHEIREEGERVVVALRGDVDLSHSPEARQLLLDQIGRKCDLIVDLSGVSYIDSSGIASLVEAFQAARRQGSGFALAAVSESALRVLRLARLDKVFPIHASVAEGLTHGR